LVKVEINNLDETTRRDHTLTSTPRLLTSACAYNHHIHSIPCLINYDTIHI